MNDDVIVPAMAILTVCTFAVLLVLRFVAKLKWLTSIGVSVLAGLVFCTVALQSYSGAPKILLGPLGLMPAAVCILILVLQFLRWASSGEDEGVNAAEREKILRMVEDGKIRPEEGGELLDAIGRSTALRAQEKFSRLDMATLVGAVLVILGFFLPWAHLRMPEIARSQAPDFIRNISMRQMGYDAGAVGWMIFIIGVLSAVPVFVTPKDFLYKISMLQIFLILIGLVLVISVLVRVSNNMGAGLIICLAGFVVELCTSAAKFKKLAA